MWVHACACVCSCVCRYICDCTCIFVCMPYGGQQKALSSSLQELSTLVFCDRVSHSLGILPLDLVVWPRSPRNLTLFISAVRGPLHFYAQLCWVSSIAQLQVLILTRWAPYRWCQLLGLNSSFKYCSLVMGCQLLQELGPFWVLS